MGNNISKITNTSNEIAHCILITLRSNKLLIQKNPNKETILGIQSLYLQPTLL